MHPSALSVELSRLQFAVSTTFHIVWPVLTIGLSILLVALEALWLKTGDKDYYRHARFWAKLFLLNFGIGVATGLPLEFEFGTNWSPFSQTAGSFFGNMLGFEGAMAFMLEAGFLGIMLFGWKRVAPAIHLFATCMVALGGTLSAFWIMVANSWMQTPAGGKFVNGHFIVTDYVAAILNPNMPWGTSHMWVAALETSLFVIGGLSAWYLLKNRHNAFFLKSLKLVLALAIVVTPIQIFLGDGSGGNVFEYQPAKGAAIEGHWKTNAKGTPAAWSLIGWPSKSEQKNLWSLDVPYGLSLLATHTLTGQVTGLDEFAPRDQPPLLPLIYYAFRVMVAIGFWFFFLMLASVWFWWRGGLRPETVGRHRKLLWAWLASIPLGYVAVECGWTVREVGRQPWVIYNVMRTSRGASALPAGSVGTTTVLFIVAYALLILTFLYFAIRIFRKGPDLEMEPPARHGRWLIDTRPAPESSDHSSKEEL
jgi:cytochrome d ubiquinol oxidase subunit I